MGIGALGLDGLSMQRMGESLWVCLCWVSGWHVCMCYSV